MRKSFLAGALSLCLLGGLLFSPYGLPGIQRIKAERQVATDSINALNSTLSQAQSAAVAEVQNFIDGRTFGVAYDDIGKLASVLSSVSGIEMLGVYDVDPANGYVDTGYHIEGTQAEAVRFELLVEDPMVALNAIDTLQLAIVSIELEAPDWVSIIFLTGGSV